MNTSGQVFWLFGLSGAGKSTLATALAADLRSQGLHPLELDGDALRSGVCRGLGFSDEDRAENLRRAASVAQIGLHSKLPVIAAFITPLEAHRQLVASVLGRSRVSFIFINAPLSLCRERDVKGLYAKAQAGKIPQMTGVTSSFEPPQDVDLVIDTARHSLAECREKLWQHACAKLASNT